MLCRFFLSFLKAAFQSTVCTQYNPKQMLQLTFFLHLWCITGNLSTLVVEYYLKNLSKCCISPFVKAFQSILKECKFNSLVVRHFTEESVHCQESDKAAFFKSYGTEMDTVLGHLFSSLVCMISVTSKSGFVFDFNI